MRLLAALALLVSACVTAGPVAPPSPPQLGSPVTLPEAPKQCRIEPPTEADTKAPPDVATPPVDAVRSASGLASKVLRPGCGHRRPSSFSVVRVHYSGWQADGRLFDSSVVRGEPTQFALDGVVPGWREGVKLMVEGEKRRLWIPEELAYKGTSGPQGLLVFDVELLEIVKP